MKNICIESKNLYPNALIYGNPTVSNGIISGFSEGNYLQILNGKQDNNAEYVVKFTTGSTTKSTSQDIYCAENFFVLEILANTWNFVTYNWETASSTTLFTATANTTYWVKISVNGKTKTFRYSTDGENYTQVASFTDNNMDITNDYPLRIGNHSRNSLLTERAFWGSVDLNETYINVNNVRFWDGMDYKKYLPIGGDIADGRFTYNGITAYSGKPSPPFYSVISLENYLPNDNYDYEILFSGHIYTGQTSGNYTTTRIASGTMTQDDFSDGKCLTLGRVRTRTASTRETAASGTLPIFANDRNISLYFSGSGSLPSSSTLNCNVRIYGYRRIGTNNDNENCIEKINSYTISGDNFDGKWVDTNFTRISLYTYTAGNTYTFNLKSLGLIPNDDYQYEIIISGWCATGTTSGNYSGVFVYSSLFDESFTLNMNYANTRTANKNDSWKSTVLPIGADGKLYIINTAPSGVKADTEIYLCGYRRIGLNE